MILLKIILILASIQNPVKKSNTIDYQIISPTNSKLQLHLYQPNGPFILGIEWGTINQQYIYEGIIYHYPTKKIYHIKNLATTPPPQNASFVPECSTVYNDQLLIYGRFRFAVEMKDNWVLSLPLDPNQWIENPTTQPTIPYPDHDHDGDLDSNDYTIMMSCYKWPNPVSTPLIDDCSECDYNHDGVVNDADKTRFSELVKYWRDHQ